MARLAGLIRKRLIRKIGSELLYNGRQIQRLIVGVGNDDHRQALRFEEGAATDITFAVGVGCPTPHRRARRTKSRA